MRCINVVGLKRHASELRIHRLAARGASAALPCQDDGQACHEVLESHGHLCPEVRRLLDFIEYQQQGKHGRGRERGRA